MGLEIIRVKSLDDIDPGAWNDLLSSNETNEIFLSYQWVNCWWSTVGQSRKLLLLLAKEDGKYVGIAPLMLTPRRLGPVAYVAAEFLGTGESDYIDFIVEPRRKADVLRAFIDYMSSLSGEWDVISLENVPGKSETVPMVQAVLENSRYGIRSLPDVVCPALVISGNEEFANACANKKSLKRHYNYFKRNGQLAFSTIEDADEIIGYLPEFFQQHVERRAIAGGDSKFENQRIREFYQSLVSVLMEQDWLRFGVVKFDDKPIAFHFGFEYAGKFVWYKPTFDVEYRKKSPGEVLIKFLLEDAIEKKLDEFDFTIGNEAFKQRFANVDRINRGIEIVRSRRLLLFLNGLDKAKSIAKRYFPAPYASLKKLLGLR